MSRKHCTRSNRTGFVGLLTVIVLLYVPSVAFASNFYWYGQNHSTCWQTGQPGSPSEACSDVGPGFLPTPGGHTGGLEHMSEGGIGTDLTLSPSGDYCSYYRVGGQLTSQDSTNEGTTTGLITPTPYSSYQEGDKTVGASNACQANGSYWGQAVRGPSGKGCTETCGMHHYISFKSQGTNDRPWASVFGEPSLVLSAEAGVHTFTHTGTSYGGWGYVCPELEDTSFHGVIEYCFQEWRSANNAPEWKNERKRECGGGPWAMVNTYFWPGTSYATEMRGSTNTFEVGAAGSGHFEARITKTNLINAIKLINSECAGWHLSENPENYALVGMEQGLEGWDGVSTMGGYGESLQLSTTYSPLPPGVSTAEASNVKEEQATVNGLITPNASDTHYYFQYGTTVSYGDSTPAPPGNDIGSSGSSVPVNTTITGLLEGTTYHYRVVASNAAGTSYGADRTFKTSFIPTTPVALRESGTGYQWVYYVGKEHAIWEWTWNGSSWFNSRPGGFVLSNSNPTAVRDNTSGNQWVYYVGGGDDAIWQAYWNGSTETQTHVGGEVALNSSPIALRESSTGNQWVYYVGKSDNAIWEWTWNGSSWFNSRPGGFVASGTSLAATRDNKSGDQWVYYVGGGDGAIWQAYWNGSAETQTRVGGEVAPNTSPVVLREEGTGYQWIYYVNKSDKSIWEWTWNGSSWFQSRVGGFVAPNTTMAVVREAGTGYQWVYYVGGGDGAIWEWTWNGAKWVESRPGGLAAPETSPTVVQPWAGFQWVYYQSSEDPITQLFWGGTSWSTLVL